MYSLPARLHERESGARVLFVVDFSGAKDKRGDGGSGEEEWVALKLICQALVSNHDGWSSCVPVVRRSKVVGRSITHFFRRNGDDGETKSEYKERKMAEW